MIGAAVVIAAGGIALAILTRGGDAPLNRPSRTTPTATTANTTATNSTQPALEHSTEIASGADPVVAERDPSEPDLAGLGNGSAGEQLAKLADEFAQHHWANAMAECLSQAIMLGNPKACAISACELHDIRHASIFYSHVASADRGEVKTTCQEAHVPVERVRPGLHFHRPGMRSPPSVGSNG